MRSRALAAGVGDMHRCRSIIVVLVVLVALVLVLAAVPAAGAATAAGAPDRRASRAPGRAVATSLEPFDSQALL